MAKVAPSSPLPVTLMMEVIHSSETPVRITTTRRNVPEGGILHSHRCGNPAFNKNKKIHGF
jgi:hypothetical protein